jgi:hypothetical protein
VFYFVRNEISHVFFFAKWYTKRNFACSSVARKDTKRYSWIFGFAKQANFCEIPSVRIVFISRNKIYAKIEALCRTAVVIFFSLFVGCRLSEEPLFCIFLFHWYVVFPSKISKMSLFSCSILIRSKCRIWKRTSRYISKILLPNLMDFNDKEMIDPFKMVAFW